MDRQRSVGVGDLAVMDVDPRAFADLNIALVGAMGAGKTSIGRRLAARLGLVFIDADREIEARAGLTVSEIFAREGEARFRDLERCRIAAILEGSGQVLATGGGAFMDAETRRRIAARAVSVWLKADLDVLTRRVSRRKTRPLLAEGNPRAVLESLMAVRGPVYAQADIAVESRDAPHRETVDAVAAALLARLRRGGG